MRRRILDWRITVAAVVAMVMGASMLSAAAVAAAPSGISASVLLNGQTYEGTPVVNEGDELTLRVQYNTDVTPGSTVSFAMGPNVTITGVPPANTAISSVTHDGNDVAITFRDPWPAGVNQGVFDLRFTINAVESSAPAKITWRIDGEESSIDVIVRDRGDEFADVREGYAKSASPGNLDSFVRVVDGTVVVAPEIVDRAVTYTLRVDSPDARSALAITDSLPAGMAYVPDSFTAQLTTWDANGLNRQTGGFAFTPTIVDSSFSGTVDVPGPSILSITYQAHVTDVAALEARLQAEYDRLGGATGNFETVLTNTVSFGGVTREASVRLRGNVPGVNIGQAFAKTADWSSRNVVPAADGTLDPALPITYTLKADLRQWTGAGPHFTLNRNVVISDVLPEQASWQIGEANFITASGMTLTRVTTPPADAAAFAGDHFVGQYWVDGQRLLINVGRDAATQATFAVKAQLDTVAGLPEAGNTTVVGAIPHRLRNVAEFDYRDGTPHRTTRDVTVVVLPDTTHGIDDPSVFTKSGTARQASIEPGERVTVDYTFRVAAGQGIDVRESAIVDHVDRDVFDLGDPSAATVTGTYDGQTLDAQHFDTRIDDDGNLVIELSAWGDLLVTARGVDKELRVVVALTSTPFEGKETRTIENRATLTGEGDNPDYVSGTESEATSYGDEAEVRKRVYDRSTDSWVSELPVHMDGQGGLVEDTYVYRIEFIPHGSYDGVVIVPVVDVLPDAVSFLGFVSPDDTATVADPTTGPVDIGGNLEASEADGVVTIRQKSGTVLAAGAPIAAYVAVEVDDASASIVNRIGDTSAEIIPIRSVSVGDLVWVDSDRDGRQDDGEPGIPGVVLTLEGPDGQPVTDVDGRPVGPTTTGPNGEYTFDRLPALSGDQTYTIRLDEEASAEALAPYVPTLDGVGDRVLDSSTWESSTVPGQLQEDGDRDPTLDFGFVLKTYAIGDVVWVDADRNGRQGPDETPLHGVIVDLLDHAGTTVATTVTDRDGRYVFDHLEAGTYHVQFTLTPEQRAVYEFTTQNAGTDAAVDSDAHPVDGRTRAIVLDDTNGALVTDYDHRTIAASQGIDPSWDAGVVLKPTAESPTGPSGSDQRDAGGPTGLPSTGLGVGLAAVLGAFVLTLLGLALIRISRRPAN